MRGRKGDFLVFPHLVHIRPGPDKKTTTLRLFKSVLDFPRQARVSLKDSFVFYETFILFVKTERNSDLMDFSYLGHIGRGPDQKQVYLICQIWTTL